MIRDDLLIHNERTKLLANSVNALGLALIAVGVLAPVAAFTRAAAQASAPTASTGLQTALWLVWMIGGLALRGLAHDIMGNRKKG